MMKRESNRTLSRFGFHSARWFTHLWFRKGNSSSCGLSPPAQLRIQEFLQHHRVIVFCIVRAINQGYRALTGRLQERLPYLCSGPKFSPVAAPELVPFGRVVAEPFSQLCTGSNILEPAVQWQRTLSDSTGPQALYQKPPAIRRGGPIICTFQ